LSEKSTFTFSHEALRGPDSTLWKKKVWQVGLEKGEMGKVEKEKAPLGESGAWIV